MYGRATSNFFVTLTASYDAGLVSTARSVGARTSSRVLGGRRPETWIVTRWGWNVIGQVRALIRTAMGTASTAATSLSNRSPCSRPPLPSLGIAAVFLEQLDTAEAR